MKIFIFITCVFLTLWAYWPSLRHAPKHDQIAYLAEVAQDDNPLKVVFGHYSLNRDREFMSGDALLFRPFLNIWLGLQKVLFGYNFSLWQGTAILLHVLVGVFLFRLLETIRPGIPAAVCSGFFLLMLSNLPLVSWHHVSGYLIFWALTLESLRRLLLFLRSPAQKGSLWASMVCLALAAFIFEAGILFAFCFAALLFFYQKDRQGAFLMLIPVGLFLCINTLDFLVRAPVIYSEAGRLADRVLSLKTLLNLGITLKWFLATGLFLNGADIILIERIAISPITFLGGWPATHVTPHFWRGLMAIVLFGALIIFSLRSLKPAEKKFSIMVFTMIACLLIFISVGRVNTRGLLTGLLFNSYYVYFFWVLFIPAVYALFDFSRIKAHPNGRLLCVSAYLVLASIMFINILSIRVVNTKIAKLDSDRRGLIDSLSLFTQQHRHEPDFTFFIPHTCPGNYPGSWLRKKNDPLWRRYTLGEALFPRFYLGKGEKYRLMCNPRGQ